MNRLSRTTAVKIAAAISFVIALYSIVWSIPYLLQGAEAVSQGTDTPPYFIVLMGPISSTLKLAGALGAWRNQRWGIILILLTNSVDILMGAPGLLFAPTLRLWIESIIFTTLEIVAVILCLWRDPRPALAQQGQINQGSNEVG